MKTTKEIIVVDKPVSEERQLMYRIEASLMNQGYNLFDTIILSAASFFPMAANTTISSVVRFFAIRKQGS